MIIIISGKVNQLKLKKINSNLKMNMISLNILEQKDNNIKTLKNSYQIIMKSRNMNKYLRDVNA